MQAFWRCGAAPVAGLLAVLMGVSAEHAVETPITRVATLLQGLAKKTEMEGKVEEDLYEKYVCWAKSVISSKTASNAQAASKIDSLSTYVADIEAGRYEFTGERADLEKDISEINTDIESFTTMREKEQTEFEAAEDEMTKAIAALDSALAVLKEASDGRETGTLLAQRGRARLGAGFAARQKASADLALAAKLGEKVLSAGDAVFLQRLLGGEVPVSDWNKLNRKAKFKHSYKARSFKIQDILKAMREEFASNLEDATKKNGEAKTTFEGFTETKEQQLSSAELALGEMKVENGARAMNKEEAQAELEALTTQVGSDKTYIEQVKTSLEEKKVEWKDRQALRTAEIAAMSKAVEILYNDDARDLFKKSFKSQSYSFLQEDSHRRSTRRARRTGLHVARRSLSTAKVAEGLPNAPPSGSPFGKVIMAIDKMIANLKAEENTDLAGKESCEKERAEDTREAITLGRSIDESTDKISKLESDIQDLASKIADSKEEVKKTQAELTETRKIRKEEKAEFKVSDADDKEAKATVIRAKDVLENFYADNKLMGFIQQPAKSVAGEAPPPPPTTWDAPYGGKTEAATGVIQILAMVIEDIQKDIDKAISSEQKAAAEYDTFAEESRTQIKGLNRLIIQLKRSKADKEESVSTETGKRGSAKAELDVVMTRIENTAKKGCDYLTINYPVKLRNRQIEIDSLNSAKTGLLAKEYSASQ